MTTGTLAVPGARLFYKMCGRGPRLFVLQGGAADADGFDGVAKYLANDYTVVTYDRRGLSRSVMVDPAARVTIEMHSDDAGHLMQSLTDEPALVLGCSFGGLIGLDVLLRNPGQIQTLIVHEPPDASLLSGTILERTRLAQVELEEVYRREGRSVAMGQFMAFTGVHFRDREPDLERPRPSEYAAANADFFLANDTPAVRVYELNVAALKGLRERILPAAGSTDPELWIYQCARSLAGQLGITLSEFPGGHAGYATHPRAFAARLQEVLAPTNAVGEHA